MDSTDFGHVPLGSKPTLTFVFYQKNDLGEEVPADPGATPYVEMTAGAGATKAHYTLARTTVGTFTLKPSCTVAGGWSGTAIAPEGFDGQATFPFHFTVDPNPNYP